MIEPLKISSASRMKAQPLAIGSRGIRSISARSIASLRLSLPVKIGFAPANLAATAR